MASLISLIDAVNRCLKAVGTAPVNSLDDLPTDAEMAYNTVQDVNKALQAEGWAWNTHYQTLPRNEDDEVPVPANAIAVDVPTLWYPEIDPIIRNGLLFDRNNNTYEFADDLEKCLVTCYLDWDEIPETARVYIAVEAARLFAHDTMPESERDAILSYESKRARALLMADEIRQSDASMFDSVTASRQFLSRYRQRY